MNDRPVPWPPLDPFADHDEPSSVRVILGEQPPLERARPAEPKPEIQPAIGRLGKPWEREARDDLERALAAARAMREDSEAFVGWIGRFDLRLAADYDHLIDDTDALIHRLERLSEQL